MSRHLRFYCQQSLAFWQNEGGQVTSTGTDFEDLISALQVRLVDYTLASTGVDEDICNIEAHDQE